MMSRPKQTRRRLTTLAAGWIILLSACASTGDSSPSTTTEKDNMETTPNDPTTPRTAVSGSTTDSPLAGKVLLSQELTPSACVYQRLATADGNSDAGYTPTVVMPDGSTQDLLPPDGWADIWQTCFVKAGVMPDEEMALFLASTVFQFSSGYVVRPEDVDKLAVYFERGGYTYTEPSVEFSDDGFIARFFFFDEPILALSWLELQVSPDFVGYINQGNDTDG